MPHIRWGMLLLDTWWRHQMETFSALLALCAGNSPGTGEFPSQRPVTRSFDVFFDMCLNKQLSKQSWGWWFETLSRSLWRHCNENAAILILWTPWCQLGRAKPMGSDEGNGLLAHVTYHQNNLISRRSFPWQWTAWTTCISSNVMTTNLCSNS